MNEFSWLLIKHKFYENPRIRNRGFEIPNHLTKESNPDSNPMRIISKGFESGFESSPNGIRIRRIQIRIRTHACHMPIRKQDYSSAHPPDTSSSRSSHFPHSHKPGHPRVHQQDQEQDHPFDDSSNPESKDLPHFIDIDHPRTKTMRSKRARHRSTDTELCNVMISPVFEPRLKNRKVLTSPINIIFDNDILPQLKNDFTEWT